MFELLKLRVLEVQIIEFFQELAMKILSVPENFIQIIESSNYVDSNYV